MWNDTESKMDQIIKHYDQIGLISQENTTNQSNSQQQQPANIIVVP